jgi:hypothetical protein
MDSLADRILGLPDSVKWALAIAGMALGAPAILWPDRIVRGIRKWLVIQLRWVRRPRYRRFLKLYGWLLFVTGALLAAMLLLSGRS